jgi:maleylpyruvate isomerase
MKLYHFHSSSTSFRVRIALNLKGLEVEYVPVTLGWKDPDHLKPEYRSFNPQLNVPVLIDGDAQIMQSLAIIEYLEEKHPEPPLLPRDAAGRARVRSLALNVTCEIQSPNNLRVQRQLSEQLGADRPALGRWQLHWITVGFDGLEEQLAKSPFTGKFCHGDTPTIADIFLVPQVYNARRPVVGADMGRWPTISRIVEACLALPAFDRAQPTKQPDFVSPDGH